MKIYAISGLGANEKVFENLILPPNHELVFIPWILPLENESLEDYTFRMAENIDKKEDFILLGLSFGGILAQEVARIKPPKKLLLFSTVKSDQEKPLWIRLNKYLKLYKHFPYSWLNESPIIDTFSRFMQFLNPKRPSLSEMYTMRNSIYTRWAFEQIAHWDPKDSLNCELVHFHGRYDFVFPIWNIKGATKVYSAGHLAIYVRAKQVSADLKQILSFSNHS
jgi:pimeloyl-ACP methyl ester carboxylesterase